MVLDAESTRNAVDQLSGDYHSNTSTALIANSQVVFGVLGTRMRDLLDTGTLRMPAMAPNLMPSTFIALRNAQPTRYVWNTNGEEILSKIQRAGEELETVQIELVISRTAHRGGAIKKAPFGG